MNTLFKRYGTLLLLVIWCATASAEEKTKSVNRSFKVSPSTLVEIDNKFGKVHVNSWDKDEVNVSIRIVAEGKDPDNILDRIDIRFDHRTSSDYLLIKTELEEFNSKKSTFSINYTIDMPRHNKVKLRNKFGDTYLANRDGDVELNIGYGNLKTGNLDGFTKLNLEFGSAMSQMAAIKSGELDIKYSKLTIDKSGALKINAQYSDVFGSSLGKTDLQMKYGKFIVENSGGVSGGQSYSEFRVNHISGNLVLDVKHNQVYVEKVSSKVKEIRLNGQYSNMQLGLDSNFSCTFSLNLEYADLKYTGNNIDFEKSIKETVKKYYEGSIGSGSKASTLRVNSKYGDLKLSN